MLKQESRVGESRANGNDRASHQPTSSEPARSLNGASLSSTHWAHLFVKASKIFLPAIIAYFLIRPLLDGDYFYPVGEYQLYKSFMQNFIAALRHGELLKWNPFVGDGHPAMYFGHVPITQNTLIYMLFGFSDQTYYFTKFLSLWAMLALFVWAARLLGFKYLVGLIGALFYFCINFVLRILPSETIGNLLPLYPPLMMLVPLLVARRPAPWKGVVIFIGVYVFWLTGGHVTYVPAHLIALSILFVVAVFTYRGRAAWRELPYFISLYGLVMILPLAAVLYQYVFIADIIADSNRIKPGLIVSPFHSDVWVELLRSLRSSSFVWLAIFITAWLIFLKWRERSGRVPLRVVWRGTRWQAATIAVFVLLAATGVQIPAIWPLRDVVPLLNDSIFRGAFIAFVICQGVLGREGRLYVVSQSAAWALFLVMSFLAYFIIAPENIIGDVHGYDYDLFMELSPQLRAVFLFLMLYSVTAWRHSRLFKVMVIELVALYLIRSHLTIPMLRFTGFVWYATRDGSIFSTCLALLSMIGLARFIDDLGLLARREPSRQAAAWLRHHVLASLGRAGNLLRRVDGRQLLAVALLGVIALQTHDSWEKMYHGLSHRFIFPKRDPQSGWEKSVVDQINEAAMLRNTLISLQNDNPGFFRIYAPENSYIFISGALQDAGIYDAAIYDSSMSAIYKDFYDRIILGHPPETTLPLAQVMPYMLFTRHVHEGIGLAYRQIAYRDFFVFNTDDESALKEGNIRFFWDVSSVRYLVVGPKFEQALGELGGPSRYRLLARYKALALALYERLDFRQGVEAAVLPLRSLEDANAALTALNSDDVQTMEEARKSLLPLAVGMAKAQGYRLTAASEHNGRNVLTLEADRPGLLIEFESWNKHWRATINGGAAPVDKAFHIFKVIPFLPGRHTIVTEYAPPYFFPLIVLGAVSMLVVFVMLVSVLLPRWRVRSRTRS